MGAGWLVMIIVAIPVLGLMYMFMTPVAYSFHTNPILNSTSYNEVYGEAGDSLYQMVAVGGLLVGLFAIAIYGFSQRSKGGF